MTSRIDPPYQAEERAMLDSWLEFHRATLGWKCDGLTDEQLRERSVPPSTMSLIGLVRHMAEVERNWFRRVLLREPDTPPIWYDPAVEDSDLVPLDDADWATDLTTWRAECEHSRVAAAAHGLDDTGIRRGEECSLRWIYVHMIEEYARHNGHADLLRELVDGAVGW
jgi:uncharacterized damage-inducible protein DinB